MTNRMGFFVLYALLATLLGITGHTTTAAIMLGTYALILLGLEARKEFWK